MQEAQEEYNYEAERQKLKLSPFATCVLLFKTTVGVGIFTYQYAYAKVATRDKCGFVLGTLLSALTFYMVIYGMYRLIELCEYIEEMETEKKKQLTKQASGEMQQPSTELKDQKSVNNDQTETPNPVDSKPLENYELDRASERFQVITYHREFLLLRSSEQIHWKAEKTTGCFFSFLHHRYRVRLQLWQSSILSKGFDGAHFITDQTSHFPRLSDHSVHAGLD